MRQCHLYLRSDETLGVTEQRLACRTYAGEQGWEVGLEFVDRGVGSEDPVEHCRALFRALAELKGGDVLLAARWDRFGEDFYRRVLVEHQARARGAAVLAVAGGEGAWVTDEGQRFVHILAALAVHDRMILRLRLRKGIRDRKLKGAPVGKAPFGWRYEQAPRRDWKQRVLSRLVPVPEEQKVIDIILLLKKQKKSMTHIAAILTDARTLGRAWNWRTIKHILARNEKKAKGKI